MPVTISTRHSPSTSDALAGGGVGGAEAAAAPAGPHGQQEETSREQAREGGRLPGAGPTDRDTLATTAGDARLPVGASLAFSSRLGWAGGACIEGRSGQGCRTADEPSRMTVDDPRHRLTPTRQERRARRLRQAPLALAGVIAVVTAGFADGPRHRRHHRCSPTRRRRPASPSASPIFDFATLGGGDNPTGTITFTLYGPDDPTCAGTAASPVGETVTGNGNYQSDNFTTEPGRHLPVGRPLQRRRQQHRRRHRLQRPGRAGRPWPSGPPPSPPRRRRRCRSAASSPTPPPSPAAPAPPAPRARSPSTCTARDNLTCAPPAAFTTTVTVTGNGQYTSAPFTPTAAGHLPVGGGLQRRRQQQRPPAPSAPTRPSPSSSRPAGSITPTITTTASPSVAVGGQVTDTATLAGGTAPTGTITFTLYGPDDATCAGTAGLHRPPITVTGNGQYTLRPVHPHRRRHLPVGGVLQRRRHPQPGDHRVQRPQRVGGRHRRRRRSRPRSPPPPRRRWPSADRSPTPPPWPAAPTPPAPSPSPSTAPTTPPAPATAAFTEHQDRHRQRPRTRPARSPPPRAGTYRWVAAYSGDANNNAVTTACNAPNESVVVTAGPARSRRRSPPPPSPSVAVGGQVTDTATLAGGTNPTGTITFTLYGPDDATCAAAAIFTDPATVSGNGPYASDPFTPTAAGTYRWVAAYSGDAATTPVTTACNDRQRVGGGHRRPRPVTPTITTNASGTVDRRRADHRHRHPGRRQQPHRHHHLQPLRPRRRHVRPGRSPSSAPRRSPATASTPPTRSPPPPPAPTGGGRATAATPTTTPSPPRATTPTSRWW